MDRTGSRRSRCRVCRDHFRADPRAATQKVCTKECGRIRRREQAKQRRADDLEGHREAERARQQAWRDARRAGPVAPATSSRSVAPATSSRSVTPATSSPSVTGVPLGPVTRRHRPATPWNEGGNPAGLGQGVTAVTRQLGAGSHGDPWKKCLDPGTCGTGSGACHAPG
jgi:hypothetical protein